MFGLGVREIIIIAIAVAVQYVIPIMALVFVVRISTRLARLEAEIEALRRER